MENRLLSVLNTQCKRGCPTFDGYVEKHGSQTGLYCSYCLKWIKWLSKDEVTLASNVIGDLAIQSKPVENNNVSMEQSRNQLLSRARVSNNEGYENNTSIAEAYNDIVSLSKLDVLSDRYRNSLHTLIKYIQEKEEL